MLPALCLPPLFLFLAEPLLAGAIEGKAQTALGDIRTSEVQIAGPGIVRGCEEQITRAGRRQASGTQTGEWIAAVGWPIVGQVVQKENGEIIARSQFAQGKEEVQRRFYHVALANPIAAGLVSIAVQG